MSYVNPDTMTEVANILESLDDENLRDVFKSQITDDDGYTNIQINHLSPLYGSYKRVIKLADIDDDDLNKIKNKFHNICISVINFICDKFNLEIDKDWLDSTTFHDRLPAVAMSMYQFFILDIFNVILQSLSNYISKNTDELYNAFSAVANNKDVSTVTNLKTMDPKYAVIASSIFDITDYVFTILDIETLFEYINVTYIPGYVIKLMWEQNNISGDFISVFANIYKDNLTLRSKIAFELIHKIKKQGYLFYNPLVIVRNESQTSDTSQEVHKNTDISDDVDE